MTVPPNFSVPPEHTPAPGYGFQPQYGGPPAPQKPRNYALIGGIVVGLTTLALGTTLLLVLGLTDRGGEDDTVVAGGDESSTSEPAEETTSPEAEETTTEAVVAGSDEIGQCLPYEPEISGMGLELTSCNDASAFWEITNMSYDIEARVDSDGSLLDNQVAYDLCGEDYGLSKLGEVWTNWHWVYTVDIVDSLYCIVAIGNPDEDGRLPYTPDKGDCFDDSDKWWTLDCGSSLAVYEVVGTVDIADPREMTTDEAQTEATCGGAYYWQVTDVEGRTTSILCGNEL